MSERVSFNSSVSSVDDISQNEVEDNNLIDKKTSENQEKLTSLDNIEKISTQKSSGKAGRIFAKILGGLLLAAGFAAAAVATVCSLGIAPAFVGAIAATIGGITGASIAAGVAGAAGIGFIAGSIASGRSAESFVEGQNSKHNTNDNLAMITNGNATGKVQNKVQEETFSGLTRSFNTQDKVAIYEEYEIVDANFYRAELNSAAGSVAFNKTKLDDITYAIDVKDPEHPKLLNPDHEYALKPEYITDYVKNVINLCKGKSTAFSKENIALIRYALRYCFENPIMMGTHANRIPAFSNESFIKEISDFVQDEINKIKDSNKKEDIEKYNLFSIFKAALKLSDEDIQKLAELEKQKNEKANGDNNS